MNFMYKYVYLYHDIYLVWLKKRAVPHREISSKGFWRKKQVLNCFIGLL